MKKVRIELNIIEKLKPEIENAGGEITSTIEVGCARDKWNRHDELRIRYQVVCLPDNIKCITAGGKKYQIRLQQWAAQFTDPAKTTHEIREM